MPKDPIILFDGECNLCNSAIIFIINRDKKARFKFASLQSEIGRSLLAQHQPPKLQPDSVVLLLGEEMYTASTAALKLCAFLDGAWPLMVGFIIVPRIIRDGVYNWIAKNRYRWFGKRDACKLPSPALASRFL